jgi:hypothetical protein
MDRDLNQKVVDVPAKDVPAVDRAAEVKAAAKAREDSGVLPLRRFSPTANSYIEKLQKLSAPLDRDGQPTLGEIADVILALSADLRASQKDGWNGEVTGEDVNLNDPKTHPNHARLLLIDLSNRLKGLYGLYESLEPSRAQGLTNIIEEVSQAIVDVAGAMDEKDEQKFSETIAKAADVEQQARGRLT